MGSNQILTLSGRFLILLFLQVFLLNNINLLGYVNPYLYILFIILYPFTGDKTVLIILSFFLGLSIDAFENSGGVHAAASVFAAYLRPFILNYSFGISYEHNNVSLSKATFSEKLTYLISLIIVHHTVLFAVEIFSLNHLMLLLKSTVISGLFTLALTYGSILLFSKKPA